MTKYVVIENHPQDSRVKIREDNVVQTLSSQCGTGGNNVPMVMHTFAIEGNGSRPSHQGNGYKETDKMYTLNTTEVHAVAGTLSATFYKGAGNNSVDACLVPDTKNKTVRRLTPLECERLQGLPDNFTNVEFNGKPAPDSKRYKAIGNGMAVPCSDFIMRRIAEVNNEQT